MKETKQMRVESLASEYGVVTASAIRSYGYLGPFRPRPGVDFRGVRLLDVLLRSNQILCASTVAPGDSQQNLYGQWGAIALIANHFTNECLLLFLSFTSFLLKLKMTPRLVSNQ